MCITNLNDDKNKKELRERFMRFLGYRKRRSLIKI
jgi:hypothetical protein